MPACSRSQACLTARLGNKANRGAEYQSKIRLYVRKNLTIREELIIPDTSKDTVYTIYRGEYERGQQTQTPEIYLEFKQDAAKLVLENGYTQQQASDHLGISLTAIRRWVAAERKPTHR